VKTCRLLLLACLAACISPIDHAGDRLDASVNEATQKIAAEGAKLVHQAGEEARATVTHALDAASTRLTQAVDATGAKLTGLAERPVAAVVSKLGAEDQAGFAAAQKEKGTLSALRDYWLEMVLSLLGLNGLGVSKWLLARRRAARNETVARAAVQAIEEENSVGAKRRVRGALKAHKDAPAMESLIQQFVRHVETHKTET